ncbi:hypothetical protein [Carboxylicivirga taeanensis]|uniref:hypothetical protein n=1 Tax=Carboxylicivirga taeanensis TaxID=1416875 RepID=UPI003F6DBA10
MYNGLLHAHSGIRYLALLFIVLVLIQSLIAWTGQKRFEKSHKWLININVGTFISQFIIGITLYIISSKVLFDPATFKSTLLRFYTLEHPLLMVIASLLIIHYSFKAKANTTKQTHKRIFISHAIALLLIIAAIPWPFREQLGAGWF